MYRVVALLLALLMPLQFAWGAAAAYCAHETGPDAAVHLGHHQHEHQADERAPADTQPAGDNDCGACHATCSVVASELTGGLFALVGAQRVAHPLASPPESAPSRAPDRPQWLRLA